MTREGIDSIERFWSQLAGRDMFTVSLTGAGAGTPEEETELVIAAAIAEIEAAGFQRRFIVRSRLFARNRELRTRASDCRRATLVGDVRGASSSFCDAARLPLTARVRLDLVAIRPLHPDGEKIVRDYEPPIAPPMFVSLDGLVFLSGITDTSGSLGQQVERIGASIESSLSQAGSAISRAIAATVYLAREEDPAEARAMIRAALPALAAPVTISDVEGYSAPEKRIEIEITATRD